MKLNDIVALKINPDVLVRVISIDEYDWCGVELVNAPGLPLRVMMNDLVDTGITEMNDTLSGAVNILGTEYKIKCVDNPSYGDSMGYTDFSVKEIQIKKVPHEKDLMKDLQWFQRCTLRHEIIHAFLFESGLDSNTHECECFARDEEMVDWMAIQYPKIQKAFKEAGCEY